MWKKTIECYDCHTQVYDLKSHRFHCNKFQTKYNDTIDRYFLLDVSGSMTGLKLQNAKEVLNQHVNKVSEFDRLAIITFDKNAFFKLKPRSVGQIRRQQELESLLDRIYATNLTAIWDAIYLAVSQLRNKDRKTIITVLTDGEDNSSTHTYQEVLDLVKQYSNIVLNIVHVDEKVNDKYSELCLKRGSYKNVKENNLKIELLLVLNLN